MSFTDEVFINGAMVVITTALLIFALRVLFINYCIDRRLMVSNPKDPRWFHQSRLFAKFDTPSVSDYPKLVATKEFNLTARMLFRKASVPLSDSTGKIIAYISDLIKVDENEVLLLVLFDKNKEGWKTRRKFERGDMEIFIKPRISYIEGERCITGIRSFGFVEIGAVDGRS